MSKTLSLGFVQRDVTTQLRSARELLNIAEQLNVLAARTEDKALASDIRLHAEKLVSMADDLVKNASKTGRTVAEFLNPAA